MGALSRVVYWKTISKHKCSFQPKFVGTEVINSSFSPESSLFSQAFLHFLLICDFKSQHVTLLSLAAASHTDGFYPSVSLWPPFTS